MYFGIDWVSIWLMSDPLLVIVHICVKIVYSGDRQFVNPFKFS